MGGEFRTATSYKLQATSYKLQATSYKLQATSYKLQATLVGLGKAEKFPAPGAVYEAAVGAMLAWRTALARKSAGGRSGISELYGSRKNGGQTWMSVTSLRSVRMSQIPWGGKHGLLHVIVRLHATPTKNAGRAPYDWHGPARVAACGLTLVAVFTPPDGSGRPGAA